MPEATTTGIAVEKFFRAAARAGGGGVWAPRKCRGSRGAFGATATATRSGEGLRLLQSWGMEADDAAERAENLRTHAGRYVGDYDGLSSGDDSDEEDA